MGAARHAAAALLALALAACMANPPVRVQAPPPESPGQVHTVVRGDNLYRIALQYGLDYRDIAAWNGIAEPYLIHPGDRLHLQPPTRRPAPPRALAPRPPAPVAARPAPPPPAATAPAIQRPLPPPAPVARGAPAIATTPPLPPPHPPVAAPPSAGTWRWPARGRAVRGYSAAHGGNKGVDIAASAGDPVWAARDGTVVYVGDGLKQYGNLVILRHDAEYLSAYGHLGEALVQEGASVRAGQPIAYVGGPAGEGLLHFEIRRRGEPVNPAGVIGSALNP